MTNRSNPLDEGKDLFEARRRRIMNARLQRRVVLKAGALLGLGGTLSLPAILAACSSDSGDGSSGLTASPTGASGSASTDTGWDDTTITPPYTQGLASATVPEIFQQYPYVYKYNWRRHNFDRPLTTGGTIVRGYGPFPNWDFLQSVGGPIGQTFMNGLAHHAIHQGIDLEGAALELDMAVSAEHNADYTQWIVKIPPDVKFQTTAPFNGRLCTAEDWAFSFNQYLTNSIWSTALRSIAKVTATDATTLRFDLKSPVLNFLSILELPYYNVLAQEHVEDQDLFKSTPIGTGAFRVTYSKYQDHLEAERHPDYFGRPTWMAPEYRDIRLPFADKILFNFHASDTDTRAAFVAGKIDEYNITFLDPPILKEVLEAAPKSQVTVNTTWAATPTWIVWNYANPLFQDIRVRRALSMAIDREAIVRDVLGGAGVPGGSPVSYDLQGLSAPPALSDYGPYYQFNPQEAKRLMADAGYADGFSVEMEIPSPPAGVFFNIYTGVAQYWRDILKVDLKLVAVDSVIQRTDQLTRNFKDMIQPFSFVGYDVDTSASPWLYPGSDTNIGNVDDPQLGDLLDRIRTATDPETEQQLTREMLQRVYDQVSYLWICWTEGCTLSQPWVTGITNTIYGFASYFGASNWRNVWMQPDAPDGRGGKLV